MARWRQGRNKLDQVGTWQEPGEDTDFIGTCSTHALDEYLFDLNERMDIEGDMADAGCCARSSDVKHIGCDSIDAEYKEGDGTQVVRSLDRGEEVVEGSNGYGWEMCKNSAYESNVMSLDTKKYECAPMCM